MNSYVLKLPGNGRRSFLLLERSRVAGNIKHKKLESHAIEEINTRLHGNLLSRAEGEKLARQVRADLYRERKSMIAPLVFNAENQKLFENYWRSEYSYRELVDEQTLRNDFMRALKAVGPLSLLVVSRETLQQQISKCADVSKRRRIITRINSLLTFSNRGFRLRKERIFRHDVKHLTHSEFSEVLSLLPNQIVKLAAQAAFFTGCRIGELFALKPDNLKAKFIVVDGQLDREGKLRATKNRIIRRAYIIAEGYDVVQEWTRLSDKFCYRNWRFADLIRRACILKFPGQPAKHCTFHDLRHSYATYLLNHGVSIPLVAQSLGNGVEVCQQHYYGFVLRNEGIDTIDSIMNASI